MQKRVLCPVLFFCGESLNRAAIGNFADASEDIGSTSVQASESLFSLWDAEFGLRVSVCACVCVRVCAEAREREQRERCFSLFFCLVRTSNSFKGFRGGNDDLER